MPILHISGDRNFISDSKKIFERYFPQENIFIINSKTEKLNVITNSNGMVVMDLYNKENYPKILNICLNKNVDKLVIHGMAPYMYHLIKFLKKHLSFKIFWIYWGYELYQTIGYDKGYKLTDNNFNPFNKLSYYSINKFSKIFRIIIGRYYPKYYKKLFNIVDYFCFWNKLDYELLQKYYKTNLKYRFFAYGANEKTISTNNNAPEFSDTQSYKIMINHQASLFGNHRTVFKIIQEIDKNNQYEKIVPLSYGSNGIKEYVLKIGRHFFKEKFVAILNLLPREKYFDLIKTVDVAIFGQRRQEASGNISTLLKNGVKIFLRNDNNLLQFYREKGYIIYSIEDDLKDLNSLKPLTIEEKLHNHQCSINNRIYYDDFMPSLFNIDQ